MSRDGEIYICLQPAEVAIRDLGQHQHGQQPRGQHAKGDSPFLCHREDSRDGYYHGRCGVRHRRRRHYAGVGWCYWASIWCKQGLVSGLNTVGSCGVSDCDGTGATFFEARISSRLLSMMANWSYVSRVLLCISDVGWTASGCRWTSSLESVTAHNIGNQCKGQQPNLMMRVAAQFASNLVSCTRLALCTSCLQDMTWMCQANIM